MAATARRLAELTADQRRAALAGLAPADLSALEYSWQFWRQPHQIPPTPPWRLWLLCAGRGAGKSWTGAQWVRNQIETGRRRSIALVAPTHLAGRKIMIEDGLLRLCPPDNMPTYEMATGVVRWPNGGVCHLLSSETPDRLRGFNFDAAWCDEIGAWENAQDTWDQLSFALRLTGPQGDEPQIVGTTTPRNTKLLRTLLADPGTRVTRATTYDNAANLNSAVLTHLEARYSGTRTGRQELLGELLVDAEGALWTRAMMDECHVEHAPPDLRRIVVSIDPAGSSNKHSDETGIIVAGIDRAGIGYVLKDLSGKYSPETWARKAIGAYRTWRADRIIAEKNFGGDMVLSTLKNVDPGVPVKLVTASRGKSVRAEPIAALYEQGRVRHVGNLGALEDQLAEWDPAGSGPSPDRLDACIARGSLIQTRRGEVPIEDVVVGDYALTRRGYRKVTAARMTSPQADVILIETTDGSVFATPDHRFFVNGVWTRCDAIVCGDIATGWKKPLYQSALMDLSSPVSPTAKAVPDGFITQRMSRAAVRKGLASFTSKSGSMRTALIAFLMDILFIMLTATRSTMRRTISSASTTASTATSMPTCTEPLSNWLIWPAYGRWPHRGTALRKDGYGIVRSASGCGMAPYSVHTAANPVALSSNRATTSKLSGSVPEGVTAGLLTGPSGMRLKSLARSVRSLFGRTSTSPGPRLAQLCVVRVTGRSKLPVYDLTVEGEHEFFANGLLVHNCVWALTELMGRPPMSISKECLDLFSRPAPGATRTGWI